MSTYIKTGIVVVAALLAYDLFIKGLVRSSNYEKDRLQ